MVLAIVGSHLLVARPAFAQPSPPVPPAPAPQGATPDPKRGAELFKQAQALGKDPSKRDQACDLYAESQTLAPSIATRLALADCREKQGRLYDAYLEFSGASLDAIGARDTKREKQATERAAALVPNLVRVSVRIASPNAAGLELAIGGRKLTYAQWKEVNVAAPGTIAVDATAPGYQTFHFERPANPGEEVVVDVPQLIAAIAPPAPLPAPPPAQPMSGEHEAKIKKARRLMIIGGVGFGVSCLIALHASSRYDDAVDELDFDDVDSAQLQADFATLVGATGLVVAGIGWWKYREAKRAHLMVTPAVTPTTAGVSVTGRF